MPILSQQQVDDALEHYGLLLNELTVNEACPELRAELQESIGAVMATLRDGLVIPETGQLDVPEDYEELAQDVAAIGAEFDRCVNPSGGSVWPIVGVFGVLGGLLVWSLIKKR